MSTPTLAINDSAEVKERIERFRDVHRGIVREVRKVIVGQDEVIEQVMISLFVGGHCLITGLPGTAKTLLIKTLAQAVHLTFNRVQFTPDLMPSDIIGTEVIEEDRVSGRREIRFQAALNHGPMRNGRKGGTIICPALRNCFGLITRVSRGRAVGVHRWLGKSYNDKN